MDRAIGSARGCEVDHGSSCSHERQGIQCYKVQLFDKVLPSLLYLIHDAEGAGDQLLNEKLLHEGWVCHEPANNSPGCLHTAEGKSQL